MWYTLKSKVVVKVDLLNCDRRICSSQGLSRLFYSPLAKLSALYFQQQMASTPLCPPSPVFDPKGCNDSQMAKPSHMYPCWMDWVSTNAVPFVHQHCVKGFLLVVNIPIFLVNDVLPVLPFQSDDAIAVRVLQVLENLSNQLFFPCEHMVLFGKYEIFSVRQKSWGILSVAMWASALFFGIIKWVLAYLCCKKVPYLWVNRVNFQSKKRIFVNNLEWNAQSMKDLSVLKTRANFWAQHNKLSVFQRPIVDSEDIKTCGEQDGPIKYVPV